MTDLTPINAFALPPSCDDEPYASVVKYGLHKGDPALEGIDQRDLLTYMKTGVQLGIMYYVIISCTSNNIVSNETFSEPALPYFSSLVHFKVNTNVLSLHTEYLQEVPLWVDKAKLLEAQQVYRKLHALYAMVLLGALVNGYIIPRFSEVLILAGYGSSPRMATRRFKDTGRVEINLFIITHTSILMFDM